MSRPEVVALLGECDNDMGYFSAPDRYVCCPGPERGLISIDSEWLILDFEDVSHDGLTSSAPLWQIFSIQECIFFAFLPINISEGCPDRASLSVILFKDNG